MSYLTLNSETQSAVYEELVKRLSGIGLEAFPIKRRILENKSIGLSGATKKRQEETEQCVGWRKYYEGGYFIEVLPTFNEEKGTFSEEGIASVLVKSPSKTKGFKKNLQLYFYRQSGMVEKIAGIVYFLDKALKERPYGKDGTLAELQRIGDTGFYFVTTEGTKIKLNGSRFFKLLEGVPHLEVVQAIFKNRDYYHSTKDPNTRPIQEIKHKRKVKTPKKAVPEFA